jgi:hypothetical protein
MGGTLTAAGRPAEAVTYIHTAMRLDPHYPPLFTFFLGLAQFAMERFEEAAVSFATAARLNPDDEYAFAALGATSGLLGRKDDARSAIAQYDKLRVARGAVPFTIGTAPELSFWKLGFWRDADIQRVVKGFRLAGVPESLFRGEFAARNRLAADELRTLLLGHRLHGRSAESGEERSASFTTDGVTTLSGNWVLGGGSLTGGTMSLSMDGELCCKFGVISYCGAVLRNPGGTRAKENQFVWAMGSGYTFSQVE